MDLLFLKDHKMGDEGGVLNQEAEDWGTKEVFDEPRDTINNCVDSSEITKQEPLRNESEQEKPSAVEETKETVPQKQVPKNVVTSWTEWKSKTATAVVEETKKQENNSQSQVKRYAKLY